MVYEIESGINGYRRFALGVRGLRADYVVDRLSRGRYRGVRGVKPVITAEAKLVEHPSGALWNALTPYDLVGVSA